MWSRASRQLALRVLERAIWTAHEPHYSRVRAQASQIRLQGLHRWVLQRTVRDRAKAWRATQTLQNSINPAGPIDVWRIRSRRRAMAVNFIEDAGRSRRQGRAMLSGVRGKVTASGVDAAARSPPLHPTLKS